MTALAVTGYASVDYVIGLSGQVRGDHTTLIDHRTSDRWPRIGGCPAFAAIAAARAGVQSMPITWVGTDSHAQLYLDSLSSAGVSIGGVEQLDRPSPMSILAYQQDGSCACLFDPGFTGEEQLTNPQRELIASSSHLCISVGPPQLMDQILESLGEATRLYWVCKNDPHCFTSQIRAELSNKADVIFCSSSERSLVGETKPGAVIVETRGTDGVVVGCGENTDMVPVEPISVRDTTGAGDTFAGAFIAAEMSGETDPLKSASAGIAAVRALLVVRADEERS